MKPEFDNHQTTYKRIFLLDSLPEPLKPADEHWQIFDDYTAWPEFRLRRIRIPQTREWFAMKEEMIVSETEAGFREELTRIFLPADDVGGHGPHPDKEIRKNRYFYKTENGEFAVDVFLGTLWGLILAQIDFTGVKETERFPRPDFAVREISDKRFFRGENLVEKNFEQVREEVIGSR